MENKYYTHTSETCMVAGVEFVAEHPTSISGGRIWKSINHPVTYSVWWRNSMLLGQEWYASQRNGEDFPYIGLFGFETLAQAWDAIINDIQQNK